MMDKARAKEVSLNTVVSVLGSLGAVWAFAAPIAQKALAQEVKEQIQPLTDSFEILMVTNIRNLRSSIAALNFKKQQCVGVVGCWTVRDEQDLVAADAELSAAVQALASIRASKK